MNSSFDKFKKKTWLAVIVKCSLAAAAAAFLSVNVVLLPCLLSGVRLLWVWYVLIGLVGFVAGGGIAFLCLRVDDGRIAKRLDNELKLSERVQTAYAYRDMKGDMLELQRADADAALGTASGNKRSLRNIVVTVALAAALVLGVVALPVITVYADTSANAAAPVQPVDPPRPVTDWEWQALDELIEYVKASERADENAKTGMVAALEGLRTVLLSGVSQSGLPVFVRNTVTEIRNAVNDANAREGVSERQRESNSEEEQYVVSRLYEIFALQQGDNGSTDTPDKPETPEEPVSPGNNTGTGELVINGVPFFDPDRGYVSSGDTETREKYYNIIRQAMLEGTISRSEWELIVATYFADLEGSE